MYRNRIFFSCFPLFFLGAVFAQNPRTGKCDIAVLMDHSTSISQDHLKVFDEAVKSLSVYLGTTNRIALATMEVAYQNKRILLELTNNTDLIEKMMRKLNSSAIPQKNEGIVNVSDNKLAHSFKALAEMFARDANNEEFSQRRRYIVLLGDSDSTITPSILPLNIYPSSTMNVPITSSTPNNTPIKSAEVTWAEHLKNGSWPEQIAFKTNLSNLELSIPILAHIQPPEYFWQSNSGLDRYKKLVSSNWISNIREHFDVAIDYFFKELCFNRA